jgi:hypothetical protein
MFLHYIIKGRYDIDIFNHISVINKREKKLFVARRSRKFSTDRSFFIRVVHQVNFLSLKTDLDIFGATSSFKYGLKTLLLRLTHEIFNPLCSCTWFLSCRCP